MTLFFFCTVLDLVDQYDNVTKALTSTCVKHLSVEAEGLDKSAVTFMWQVKKEKLKFFVKPRFKMQFTHTIFTLSQLSLNSMRLSLFPPTYKKVKKLCCISDDKYCTFSPLHTFYSQSYYADEIKNIYIINIKS